MVGAGARCHRPVKLPETGNQEAPSLSPSPSSSIYHDSAPRAHTDSYLAAALLPGLSQSPGPFTLTLSFSLPPFSI